MDAVSDIADWWDEQRRQTDGVLDQFVTDHPNWFGVLVAGTTATAMDLGAGMVDALRLGEGTAQTVNGEGAGGIAKDALRLLSLAPGVGKVAAKLVPAAAKPGFGALARVLADRPGGICTWISGTKALRHAGVALATVEDLARAAGRPVSTLGGAWVSEITGALRSLGAQVQSLPALKNVAALETVVPKNGVVLFSVEWEIAGQKVGHTLYAFRDILGRLRIADRTGTIVKSLAELQAKHPGYGAIGTATTYGDAALVSGVRSVSQATAATAKGVSTVAMGIQGAVLATGAQGRVLPNGYATIALPVKVTTTADPHTIAEAVEVRRKHGHNSGHAPAQSTSHQPPGSSASGSAKHLNHHTVAKGESLSRIAEHYYGHWCKWPLIYEANRRLIGGNPNLIHPGQQLVIPQRPQVSGIKKRR